MNRASVKGCCALGMAAAAAGLVAGCSGGERREPFFFIQMSDPQFGMFSGDKGHEREIELFTRAIDHANRLQPAFVVVTGDLVNKPGDAEQAQAVLRVAGGLDKSIPLHWVVGNHEITNTPNQAGLDWYRKTFGEDRYSFRVGRTRFVVLNSCLIYSPTSLEAETQRQRDWLGKTLEQASGEKPDHIIVLMHHPFFLKEPGEKDEYSNIPLEQRRAYLSLLRQYGVTAVFAGHHHRNSLANEGRMEMVTTGPVGKPLGNDPSGFRIVKVYPDHIEHSYHGLDDVPEKVVLESAGP